jgi:hypothetical protein
MAAEAMSKRGQAVYKKKKAFGGTKAGMKVMVFCPFI